MNDDTAILQPIVLPDDDLSPSPPAPRRWWNRGTVALAGLVLLGGGFAGGTQVQKHLATSSASAGLPDGFNAGGAGRYGAGAGFPGAAGGTATASAAATTGTVKLVDGTTIYVQTADGSVVTVSTNASTSVSAAAKTTVQGIKAGQQVTVQGTTASDGTVTATSVTAKPK